MWKNRPYIISAVVKVSAARVENDATEKKGKCLEYHTILHFRSPVT